MALSVWLVGKQEIETFAPFDAADFQDPLPSTSGGAAVDQRRKPRFRRVSAILTRPRLLDLDSLHRLSDLDCLHCLPFPVCPWTREQSAGINNSPLAR